MLAITFLFLSVAVFAFVGAVRSFREQRRAANMSKVMSATRPRWNHVAQWSELKAGWLHWHERCQEIKALQREPLFSWGRTAVLCAAICLVGIVLQVRSDEPAFVSRIWAGFRPSHSLPSQRSQYDLSQSGFNPPANRTRQN